MCSSVRQPECPCSSQITHRASSHCPRRVMVGPASWLVSSLGKACWNNWQDWCHGCKRFSMQGNFTFHIQYFINFIFSWYRKTKMMMAGQDLKTCLRCAYERFSSAWPITEIWWQQQKRRLLLKSWVPSSACGRDCAAITFLRCRSILRWVRLKKKRRNRRRCAKSIVTFVRHIPTLTAHARVLFVRLIMIFKGNRYLCIQRSKRQITYAWF